MDKWKIESSTEKFKKAFQQGDSTQVRVDDELMIKD